MPFSSDVLAELDLPPSGISRLEDAMPLPSCIAQPAYDAETKEDDPLMWMYYLAQIALRKLLNRAHTTLYNKGWHSALESWTRISANSKQIRDGLILLAR